MQSSFRAWSTHTHISIFRGWPVEHRRGQASASGSNPSLISGATFRRSQSSAIGRGIAQLACSGTTLIGDISSSGLSPALIAETGVNAVVFRELIGLSEGRCQSALCSSRQVNR